MSGWDRSRSSSLWKQNARGGIITVRRYQQRSTAQKAPKNTLICSPVRNISVSGLMLISRRRRCQRKPVIDKESISVECHNPESTAVNTGDREKSEKRLSSVVHVERNKEPIRLRYRTDSLKVHRCIWHTLPSKDYDENQTPHVGQQRWVPESLKRVSSAAEPGADIGVTVNAMFTTDD